MHFVFIYVLSLLVLAKCTAQEEPCSIQYVSNGVIGKQVRERNTRRSVFRQIEIGESVKHNEELFLRCSEGFEGVNSGNRNTKIFCSGGKWSLEPLCQPASCNSKVPHAANTEAVHINHEHGGTVSYRCSVDYRKVTDETVTCDYGVWKGNPPTCKSSKCYIQDLKNLSHVSQESQSFAFSGDKASIICDDGYTPESKMPLCLNGKWDFDHLSLCNESNCEIPRIFGGSVKQERLGDWELTWSGFRQNLSYITIPQGTMVSSRTVLWFFCDKNYSVLGRGKPRAQITCLRGRWSIELQCLHAGQRNIPSTEKPVPKSSTSTLEPSRGSIATTTEYRPPSTTRSSWDAEGLSPTNVGEEKPQGIFTAYAPPEPPVEECFCEYRLDDRNIVAHAQGKRLVYRDKVRNGVSVKFRCLHVGYDRFRGNREITCNDCQPWHSSDFPSCVSPEKGDAVILLNSHSILLENGNIELLKGDSLNFTCAVMETAVFPEWNAPKVPGISYIRERKEREEYRDVVYFTQLQIRNADYQHEGIYECSIQGKHETMIHIIVTDKCRIPRIDGGSIKEKTLGSVRTFTGGYNRHLTYKTIPPESSVSTDTVLWLFCDKSYSVHGDGRKRVPIRCIKGRWSEDLQCLLEGESYVPSTAATVLGSFTPTLELAPIRSTTTEKIVVHSSTTTSRDVDLTSPVDVDKGNPRVVSSSEPPTEECFCKYPLDENSDIIAHANGKRLTFGDRVRNGSKVIFHCLHVGYHRFRGPREIICNNCNPWNSSHFPYCTSPMRGDAIIVLSKDVNVLKDGNIEIYKGQSINFTCVVMETAVYPEWSAPKVSGISFIRERQERKDFEDVLHLSHLQIRNADYENEGIYECSAGSNYKTVIHTVITDPQIRCPEFPGNDDILVRYEMERREKSNAWFSCSKKGHKLFGKSVLTCLNSGEWSDPTPYCSADCKVPTIDRGSFKEEKLGDWYWNWTRVRWERNLTYVTIPSGRVVPSGTELWFYCDKSYSVQGDDRQKVQIKCLEGRWPKDLQCLHESQCSIHDLAASIPDDVETDITGVNDKFVPSGSEVGLKCRDSSVMDGNAKALCGDYGNWVFGSFQCVTECRMTIDPSSHLLVQPIKEAYRFGDTVFLSCPPDEKMTIHVEMLMCLGEGWSDSLPDCREPEQSDHR